MGVAGGELLCLMPPGCTRCALTHKVFRSYWLVSILRKPFCPKMIPKWSLETPWTFFAVDFGLLCDRGF